MNDDNERFALFSNFAMLMHAGGGHTRDYVQIDKFSEHLAAGQFATSGLQSVASSLMENANRLLALSSLPFSFFIYGRCYEAAYQQFRISRGITWADGTAWDDLTDEQRDAEAKAKHDIARWAMLSQPQVFPKHGLEASSNDVAAIASKVKDRTPQHMNALGGMMVIASWAIFESLSEDLWEAALNFHPKTLGQLAGKIRSDKSREENPQRKPTDAKNRFSFDDLQRNGFDVSSQIGTILKRKDNVSFRSLYDIRASYHQAFSVNHKSVDEVLDDSGLQHAAAVRNLLIHKSGVVDKEFLEQVAGIPDVPPCKPDETYPLTGEGSAKLTDHCRVCACWLINAVHAWITNHPE